MLKLRDRFKNYVKIFRAGGPGGQSVNTTLVVRITHLLHKEYQFQQDEKSQHKNKAKGHEDIKIKNL